MRRRSRVPARTVGVRPLRNWWTRDALVVVVPVIALVALAFWIASRYIKPAPPDHLVMATGAPGGAYQRYGEKYREYLARYGVTLELRETRGAAENFALLRDGRVDVAFVQGGIGEPLREVDGEPPVVSLGALYYEPMWIFAAAGRPQVDKLADLSGSRMAIGTEGSGTRSLALLLLRESGIAAGTTYLSIGGDEALKALDAGEVDVVFQVAGIEAPVIRDMLRRRDLKQVSLAHAMAFAKRNDHLTVLTVPRGVVDIANDLPPHDITVIATTATEINTDQAHLAEATTFPNPRGQDMPIAEEAQRYYKSGKPFLKNYLPYWAANFVDRTLILLIPVFGVLIPAVRVAPLLYTYRLKSRIGRWYEQLAAVEVEVAGHPDPVRARDALSRLDTIDAEIRKAQLPNWLREQAYLLRAAIALVRERLESPEPTELPRSSEPRDATDLGTPAGLA